MRFRAAREEHGRQTGNATNTRANARSFTAAGNSANARARCRGCGDRRCIFTLAAGAGHFSFRIGFHLAGIGAVRVGVQIHRVTIREHQGVQVQAQFGFAFHVARALGIGNFSAKIRADGNHNFIVDGDGKRGAEIDGVAGFGRGRGDAVFQDDADAGARWNGDRGAGAGRDAE